METEKYKFKYDINAILSDLVYTRILEPANILIPKRFHPKHSMTGFMPYV